MEVRGLEMAEDGEPGQDEDEEVEHDGAGERVRRQTDAFLAASCREGTPDKSKQRHLGQVAVRQSTDPRMLPFGGWRDHVGGHGHSFVQEEGWRARVQRGQ